MLKTLFQRLLGLVQSNVAGVKPTLPLLGIAKIVDSTTIPLCLEKYRWAKFRKGKGGVKVHTRLVMVDSDHVFLDRAKVTSANVHDRRLLDEMVDDTDAMYVFDRGYLDYTQFEKFCKDGISFATRLKQNAVYQVLMKHLVDEESVIERDATILLGNGQSQMEHKLRLIETRDTQGYYYPHQPI